VYTCPFTIVSGTSAVDAFYNSWLPCRDDVGVLTDYVSIVFCHIIETKKIKINQFTYRKVCNGGKWEWCCIISMQYYSWSISKHTFSLKLCMT
jgi:hypothetical protein